MALSGAVPIACLGGLWFAGHGPRGPEDMMLNMPMVGWAMMLGLVVRPRRAVLACRAALVLGLVLTALATEGTLRFAIPELVWPLMAYVGSQCVSRTLDDACNEVQVEARAQAQARTEAARRAAAGAELDYLTTVVEQGQRLVAGADAGELREGVADDLRRVSRLLAETRARLA